MVTTVAKRCTYEKMRDYGPVLQELAATGVEYRPLPISAYGRLHLDTTRTLEALARTAARRRGLGDFRPLLAWARTNLRVQVWRRAASMVHACLLEAEHDDAHSAVGRDPSSAVADSVRAVPLRVGEA